MKTKGNLDLNTLSVGDTIYEFDMGFGIEAIVKTKPTLENGKWKFTATNKLTGKDINYLFTEGLAHYGPNLYGYKAYTPKAWI